MKNITTMKTFKDYFIELIKIIAFGLLLAWLISCNSSNRKQGILDEMKNYKDSIGTNNKKITVLLMETEALQKKIKESKYNLKYFIKARQKLDSIDTQMIILKSNHLFYKEKIDSLTMEFYK